MTVRPTSTTPRHAGDLALETLAPFGVDTLFTLNGGHVWHLYDAAVKQGVRIVDVRHEQTAAFAAEAWAKLTRGIGLAVLTAGPGVTNGISAITSAWFNGSPLMVLGGRAPQNRWGSGSLQELDHLPIVDSITKSARTIFDPNDTAKEIHSAAIAALTPHRGPVFCDFPFDTIFGPAAADIPAPAVPRGVAPDPGEVAKAAELLARAERPAVIVGSDVYWDRAEEALRRCAEALRLPCWFNGLGRGCLPADHDLAFTRTRGLLKAEADVVLVIGAPLDFRLGFGRFGDATVIHAVDAVSQRAPHAAAAANPAGDLAAILDGLAAWSGPRADHEAWITRITDAEAKAAAGDRTLLEAGGERIKPPRIYGELLKRLDRDGIVICDGGDFASYAGKFVEVHTPGTWLDTGPYGCLGNGPGYAMAARTRHPDRQVVVLLGDGAAGFSLMDADSLVRHGLPVVMIVGNNGIWGLEKHPMRMVYGYDVACDLQEGCRYDEVVRALGGAGETVSSPDQIGPALDRALASGVPYLVNVLTDPDDVYPRSANLG